MRSPITPPEVQALPSQPTATSAGKSRQIMVKTMANPSKTEAIEQLAAAIGENVYIDVAKWHLYLRDAHLHTILADQLYPLLSKGVTEDQVLHILRGIPIKLGGGKLEVPLADLLPMQSQMHLMDIIEEFSAS